MQKWAASITTPTPLGARHVHDGVGDLVGEPLLHLQPPGEEVDDAGHLGEPQDLAVRDVGDVRPPEERQQVVLAERIELDVPHHDHALVGLGEDRVADGLRHRHVVALGEEAQRRLHPLRRLDESFAPGVLAQRREHVADLVGERHEVGRCAGTPSSVPFVVDIVPRRLPQAEMKREAGGSAARSSRQQTRAMFSDVGTRSRNQGTSRFRFL